MATEKPRFTITMDESLLNKVDDYKFDHRIKNQSKAIVTLVAKGLEALGQDGVQDIESIKKASEEAEASPEAVRKSHIELFADVLGRAGLLGKDNDLSDADFEFLKAMLLAIKAHFKERQKDGD